LGTNAAKRTYQGTIDRESQSLVVSATPDVHARLESLVKELDVTVPESQSPIRFYKLKNTKAADVLATINGLYGQSSEPGAQNLSFDETTTEKTTPMGTPSPSGTMQPKTQGGAATPSMRGGPNGVVPAAVANPNNA